MFILFRNKNIFISYNPLDLLLIYINVSQKYTTKYFVQPSTILQSITMYILFYAKEYVLLHILTIIYVINIITYRQVSI